MIESGDQIFMKSDGKWSTQYKKEKNFGICEKGRLFLISDSEINVYFVAFNIEIILTPPVCTVGTDPGCIPDIIQTRASSMEVQGSTPGFEFIYQSTSAGYTSAKNSCEDMGGKNTFQIIKLIH